MKEAARPPAGWYEHTDHPGQERYWDGDAWTPHLRRAPGDGSSVTENGTGVSADTDDTTPLTSQKTEGEEIWGPVRWDTLSGSEDAHLRSNPPPRRDPGWYPDPVKSALSGEAGPRVRQWDGHMWTTKTRAVLPQEDPIDSRTDTGSPASALPPAESRSSVTGPQVLLILGEVVIFWLTTSAALAAVTFSQEQATGVIAVSAVGPVYAVLMVLAAVVIFGVEVARCSRGRSRSGGHIWLMLGLGAAVVSIPAVVGAVQSEGDQVDSQLRNSIESQWLQISESDRREICADPGLAAGGYANSAMEQSVHPSLTSIQIKQQAEEVIRELCS